MKGEEGRREGREGEEGGREVKGEGMGREEREGREVHNLRKTTPRHQMAGYGPADRDVHEGFLVETEARPIP